MTAPKKISRREALARLGLGAAAAYVAPAVTGLSAAMAKSGSSSSSPASRPSIASSPSPSSAPSRPSLSSGASGASDVSGVSAPSGAEAGSGSLGDAEFGDCSVSRGGNQVRISRNDYQRVQRAIRSGDAKPLREVLRSTGRAYPGQPVRVTFTSSGSSLAYHIQIVSTSGELVTVSVDAGSGSILGARKC